MVLKLSMKLLIDARTTQNQFKRHGIGSYTKNLIENIVDLKLVQDLELILYTAPTSLNIDLERSNVKIRRVKKTIGNSFFDQFEFNRSVLPILRLDLERQFFSPYFWLGLPPKDFEGKWSVFIHDMILANEDIYSPNSSIKNIIRKRQYWDQMKKIVYANNVITNSSYSKSQIQKYFPGLDDEISVTSLGTDIIESDTGRYAKYISKSSLENGYLISLGATPSPSKGSSQLIKVYYEFIEYMRSKGLEASKIPNLVIAGRAFLSSQSVAKSFRKAISKIDKFNKIELIGEYEDDDKYSLLKNSKAFISLSVEEGFGIAALEAMRSSTPVILSSMHAYEDLTGGEFATFDSNDTQSIVSFLQTITMQRKLRDQLANTAYKRSKKFDWAKSALETVKILQNVDEH